MATLFRRLLIYTNGNVEIKYPPFDVQYYRVPHDVERVNASDRPDGRKQDLRYTGRADGKARQVVLDRGVALPEVYRMKPDLHTVLDCECQRMWKDLNPMLSDRKWSTLLGNKLAWTNGTGFPGHYNCLTGEDKDSGQFPRFDANRVCGGAYLTGKEVGNLLYVDSMLTTEPIMRGSAVLKYGNLWYYGVSVNPLGKNSLITRDGIDGREYPIRIPNITSVQCYIPLDELHKWPLGKRLEAAIWLP